MTRKFHLLAGTAIVAAAVAFGGAASAAEHGVKVGTLACHVSSGWGFIFGSSRDLHCDFHPSKAPTGERYAGTISKFGVDIGYTQGGVLVWGVFAPTTNLTRGALAGDFAGATASATVGVGAGANVLIGGSNRTISLQPLSIEGNTGLNVAAGIGAINLRPGR